MAVAVPPLTAFVTLFDPVASHVPSVDTNVTLVVGDGADTTIGTEVLIEAVAGSAVGDVIWKAIDAPLTLSATVRVKPTVEIVKVTTPAPVGVTVVVNVPLASVVPEGGARVTVPAPDAATVTDCPAITAPVPLFTTTLSVAGREPTTREVVLVETVAVAPAIVIGICVDFPLAAAVIVPVRVATLVVPDENVTTAFPVASLVADDAESTPVSAENVIGTPETTAFDEFVTVAVMVVVVLLSDAIEVEEALSEIAEAVGTGVTGVTGVVVVDVPDPPPPQAPSSANSAIRKKDEITRNELVFNLCSCNRMG